MFGRWSSGGDSCIQKKERPNEQSHHIFIAIWAFQVFLAMFSFPYCHPFCESMHSNHSPNEWWSDRPTAWMTGRLMDVHVYSPSLGWVRLRSLPHGVERCSATFAEWLTGWLASGYEIQFHNHLFATWKEQQSLRLFKKYLSLISFQLLDISHFSYATACRFLQSSSICLDVCD